MYGARTTSLEGWGQAWTSLEGLGFGLGLGLRLGSTPNLTLTRARPGRSSRPPVTRRPTTYCCKTVKIKSPPQQHSSQHTSATTHRDYTHRLASRPAREAYLLCQAPRRPRLGTYTVRQTTHCVSPNLNGRGQVQKSPNCDSAPWVGSPRHVGARSRRREAPLPNLR